MTMPAGKWYWNEGPEEDVTVTWANVDEYISAVDQARVYAGVHW